jgi:Pin2-interacting protein X1
MGLAGPRMRQRISDDPQNKAWADDTSKFGYTMLQKMGWTPGKGLGQDEAGMTSHIRVHKKSDASGIGAKANTGNNWLTHVDAFSQLLANLNSQCEGAASAANENVANWDPKAALITPQDINLKEKNLKIKKDSRKLERKKTRKEGDESTETNTSPIVPTSLPPSQMPSRYAARARFLKQKKLSTSSSGNLNEIWGLEKAQKLKESDLLNGVLSEDNSASSTSLTSSLVARVENDNDEISEACPDETPMLDLGSLATMFVSSNRETDPSEQDYIKTDGQKEILSTEISSKGIEMEEKCTLQGSSQGEKRVKKEKLKKQKKQKKEKKSDKNKDKSNKRKRSTITEECNTKKKKSK